MDGGLRVDRVAGNPRGGSKGFIVSLSTVFILLFIGSPDTRRTRSLSAFPICLYNLPLLRAPVSITPTPRMATG